MGSTLKFFCCHPDFNECSELTDVLMRASCISEKGEMGGPYRRDGYH